MFSKFRVSTKIILPIVIILTIGNVVTNYITTHQMNTLAKNSAKESLEMLTNSIFITLRNAMNTGDPAVIKEAEEESRAEIKGLTSLIVAKSEKTIEMYSPGSAYTNDKETLETFETKEEQVQEIFKNDSHYLRVLKPMIATQECLLCHANQQEGDVIGVIDVTFSLDEADATISETISEILMTSLAFIVFTILVVWLVVKRTTSPLKNLKDELEIFFSFLAHEKDYIKPFKVHSMDEIGEIVVSLNENIARTTKGLEKDAEAIKESAIVCEEASKGNLHVKINATSNNPEINNLTSIVNNLLSSLSYNIDRTLTVLDCYSSDEYSKRIDSKGSTTGEVKKLFEQVDFLGETLTRLSTQNLKNGKALYDSSLVFSQNVQELAHSSKDQAKSLNETSDALSEVTQNIQNTTQSSKQMSQLANEVTKSSKQGQELASKTAISMDEINQKVEAINEAITVIDQIAFQTNILSLNAAVESATAGEAGKGFAVVAGEVRNLAARSAEAAKEIKDLVEIATSQTQMGKSIAHEMIKGYEVLNENISDTTKLIDSVARDSNIQREKIEQINDSINHIDEATQHNASIAADTNIIAQEASTIAQKIVEDASQKEQK
ncbi:methyl-accepting chemotaxis protein [Poseidonibacter lekithochrous]|uniref:methyl-accepting chemotaxis protein n=1 Tax=Poseidonibacter lekithochrous TaxID=1904463 RepID=UPI0008FC3751|nr:methyl-accepting chemotaxis protein [Poseidonibacter lekithochrous]QKJ22137.1 MCP-domain signal transduction protein [Poseidonibacter lekithochrous]